MRILDHNGKEIAERLSETRDLTLENFLRIMGADPNPSYVSAKKSFTLSTVYACVRLLANSIAMTPLKLYRRERRAPEVVQVTRGPFANIARDACPLFNNFVFWQSMVISLNGWGNGYAIIIRNEGVPQMLLYVAPYMVQFQDTSDPRYRFLRDETPYVYEVNTGMQTTFVRPEDMIHLITFTYDGLCGLSPVQLHQDTFQVENEQTKYGSSFYASGAKISGVIESPKQTSRADALEFVTWFNEIYGGNAGQVGAGRVGFLPNGLTYKNAAVVNPQDAEWVEARKLSRREIASIYGVPPYLLGDLERATWSSITQLSEEFVRYTLNPLYTVIETELNRKLLENSLNLYYEFDPSVMLRGTTSERYANYATAINAGFMSPAEVREKEGLSYREELDYFLRMPGSDAVGEEPNLEEERMLDAVKTEVAVTRALVDEQKLLSTRQKEINFETEVSIEKLRLHVDNLKEENKGLKEELVAIRDLLTQTTKRFDATDSFIKTNKDKNITIEETLENIIEKIENLEDSVTATDEN